MVLIDYNQAMISSVTTKWAMNQDMDENFLRTMFLERTRQYASKYRMKYGNMVICADDKRYWRKDVFPFYKSGRKAARAAIEIDWASVHGMMDTFLGELEENFPYKVIKIDNAEADDIIAHMVRKYSENENVLIVSADGDFAQLQKYPNVSQYSPRLKKYIKVGKPERMLKEKIIRGDAGDGIPNIFMPDNFLAIGEGRQKPVKTAKLNEWLDLPPEQFCTTPEMLRGYKRNEQLIDLNFTPQEILNKIDEQDQKKKNFRREQIFNYLLKNGLMQFKENIQEF